MLGTKLQIAEHDNVYVRQLYKCRVPTAYEVKKILDLFNDYSSYKVGLGLLSTQIMRMCEVPPLVWHKFQINEQIKKVISFKHYIYKSGNRRTKLGSNHYFKEIIKPIWSNWISDQLIGYSKIAPKYEQNKLFPWTTADALQKQFAIIRRAARNGNLDPNYDFLLDTLNETVHGRVSKAYRVSPYSLRHFSMTFHYWVTFKKDIVALSKVAGHERPDTTLKHYIKPKEAIGLDQKQIDQNISIDEFIQAGHKNQTILLEYNPEWKQRFLKSGQTTLSQY